jgi:hypothetical protein
MMCSLLAISACLWVSPSRDSYSGDNSNQYLNKGNSRLNNILEK